MTRQEIPYLGTNGISAVETKLNPFNLCPLTATLNFDLKAPGKLRLTVVGRDADSFDFVHNFTDTTSHYAKVPVLGLYEDFLNTVVLTILSPDDTIRFEERVNIQTASFPDFATINVSKNLYNDNQTHFVLMRFLIYDQQGYLRWIKEDPVFTSTEDIYPLFGQKFIYQIDDNDVNKVRIITYLGETLQEYTIPNGVHHEMIEKVPGGNLLIGTRTLNHLDDAVVEIDRVTGEVVHFWDMADYVDINRPINWFIRTGDHTCWFHLNTVRYDPTDNTLVTSARHQNLVVKFGYDDGKTKWILGNHKNWTDQHTPYLLTPLNFNTTLHEDQDWTYLQHTSTPLPNGNIMIYDNGASRPGFTNDPTQDLQDILGLDFIFIYGGYDGIPHGYARGVEYKVDPVAMTVEKVWEYTDFPTIPTSIIGSVYQIDEDHIMIAYGEHRTMSVFNKKTRQTIFMAHELAMFYRAYPVDLYPKTIIHDNSAALRGSYILCLLMSIIFSLFAF